MTGQIMPGERGEALADYVAGSQILAVAELDEHGVIVKANQTFHGLAGRQAEGQPVQSLVAREQQPMVQRMLQSREDKWQRLVLGLFPDDRGVPLDFAVSWRAVATGWLLVAEPCASVVRGVNEQLLALNDELAAAQRQITRQNAELVRSNDRLRDLDRVKDSLLASVSHDLRTPLTAILGYAELLRRRGGLDARQTQAVDVIDRNAQRLLRLVNDVLLLAQVRAGKLSLERHPVDLAQLVADAVELAQPLAEQAKLNLDAEVPADRVVVEADAARLAQLLDNLVANAIKFTPAGGRVTVRARQSRGVAAIDVEDTGIGITDADRESLFDVFVRGRSASAPGTGLGLAIVRAVADAHGARVVVAPGEGGGTRFTVSFP